MKQHRARRTHELILDAAAVEFAAYGAAGGSLERVVDRTGLTKGALYGHFSSKSALIDELLAQFDAVWQELLDQAEAAAGSALAALDRLLLDLACRLGRDPRFGCAMRLIVDEAQLEGRIPPHFPQLRDLFTRLAAKAQDLGELAAEPAAEVIGDSMLTILLGARQTTSGNQPEELVARVTKLRDLLLGVCAPTRR